MFSRNDECKSCRNSSICKWCDKMKQIHSEVSSIEIELSPISVSIKCNSFQEQPKKQDGFYTNMRQSC